MKIGRNDPCPCGSGKKFKKCCMGKAQAVPGSLHHQPVIPRPPAFPNRSANPARPSAPPSVPAPQPPDPIQEKWDAVWTEFESAPAEAHEAIFLRTLDDKELMADESAFAMLGSLHDDAVLHGKRARFGELVGALAQRRPDVYEESAAFYLSWQLQDALAEGRPDVASLAQELAARAGANIDLFQHSRGALAYHGQLATLVQALRIAWPTVKTSADVLPWAIDDFAETGMNYEILDYLEHTSSPNPSDSVLLDRIKFFAPDPRLDYLAQFIDDLTHQAPAHWTVQDFALKPPRKTARDDWVEREDDSEEPREPGALNLSRLIVQFVGYLRRVEGVPYAKGELIQDELYSYFMRRHEGELDPQPSLLERMANPKKKLPPPPRPAHPLCPERVTLDVCLAGLVTYLNPHFYTATALFELIPAWLRFLESLGLIDQERKAKTLNELRPLHATFLPLLKSYTDDPTLYRALEVWPASGL